VSQNDFSPQNLLTLHAYYHLLKKGMKPFVNGSSATVDELCDGGN
jgi:hypothetical protein